MNSQFISIVLMISSFLSNSSYAQGLILDGGPKRVNDYALFQKLHDHYSGKWAGVTDGQITSESMKDGSILIDVADHFAEFLFYHLAQAEEEFYYIPGDGAQHWLNEMVRSGPGIKCVLSSTDLKQDPLPTFRCRFKIDSEGTLSATSGFFNRAHRVNLKGNSSTLLSKNAPENSEIFRLKLFGEHSKTIFDQLDVPMTIQRMGATPIKVKSGKNIRCTVALKMDARTPGGYCEINFLPNGSTPPLSSF